MSTRFVTNVLLALAGGLVIVATQAFDPLIVGWTAFAVTGVVWLSFGLAAGMVAIALAGLTAHELSTERVVHALEDMRAPERRVEAIA